MNICLVIISDGWGGAETVVYELARHLRDKGENVSLILNQEMLRYYTDLENVEIFNIGPMYNSTALLKSIIFPTIGLRGRYSPPRRIIPLAHGYLIEFLGWIYYKRIRKQVRQFLLANRIDVIQAHLERAMLMVYNLDDLKIPTVVSSGGIQWLRGSRSPHPLVGPLMAPLVRWRARKLTKGLHKVDKVREASNFMLKAWERRGVRLKKRFIAIPNGINLAELQSSLIPTWKLKGEFNLLFPGGARFVKGGDLLIPALVKVKQEIPDIHLYIALNVRQNHPLRKMVKDLGLEENVTFVGFLPPQEYRQLLNSVDILVMPSREEAFGIVYVEAMALGKPVIAGNTGGIPEVVKNGRNGILVEPEPEQIAQAISYLYRNEAVRRKMSQNNLQDVARFDWSLITDQYIGLYKEMLGTGEVMTG